MEQKDEQVPVPKGPVPANIITPAESIADSMARIASALERSVPDEVAVGYTGNFLIGPHSTLEKIKEHGDNPAAKLPDTLDALCKALTALLPAISSHKRHLSGVGLVDLISDIKDRLTLIAQSLDTAAAPAAPQPPLDLSGAQVPQQPMPPQQPQSPFPPVNPSPQMPMGGQTRVAHPAEIQPHVAIDYANDPSRVDAAWTEGRSMGPVLVYNLAHPDNAGIAEQLGQMRGE